MRRNHQNRPLVTVTGDPLQTPWQHDKQRVGYAWCVGAVSYTLHISAELRYTATVDKSF